MVLEDVHRHADSVPLLKHLAIAWIGLARRVRKRMKIATAMRAYDHAHSIGVDHYRPDLFGELAIGEVDANENGALGVFEEARHDPVAEIPPQVARTIVLRTGALGLEQPEAAFAFAPLRIVVAHEPHFPRPARRVLLAGGAERG